MNLTKKLLASALVCAMMVPAFAVSAFAAGEAEVSYDNTSEIPDPDNPTNPTWAVTIPSTIAFTDDAKKVNADLSIIAKNGGDLPSKDIKVSAKSKNGYKLYLETAGTDDMDYAIEYTKTDGITKLTLDKRNGVTETVIDTFTDPLTNKNDPAKLTIKGEAVLQGTATKTGSHTDTITYSVEVVSAP